MGKSKIQWTHSTWPVVTGCTPCSIGCANCYAARMAATRLKHHPRYAGLAVFENGKARWTGEVRLNHDVLEQPRHWRKPRRVFVASMGDLFHDDVSPSFICGVWQVMRECPQHTFQILTKRERRMFEVITTYIANDALGFEPLPNVWLGVSIENQTAADERIPYLLQIPAAVRFVSVEPCLSTVNLTPWLRECGGGSFPIGLPLHQPHLPANWHQPALSWVICGGESGPGARPMHPDWARSLRDQCQAAGTPYFFKQFGAWMPVDCRDDLPENHYSNVRHSMGWPPMARVGKKRAGYLLDGRAWQEFPLWPIAETREKHGRE